VTVSLPRTVKDQLVDRLRADIVCGAVEPGEYLRLEDVAGRFDVSTTPVREALRELEAEGLVRIFPHRGAVVTELTPEDLADLYDIRATLEAMATRLAVPHLSPATLAELERIVDAMDGEMGHISALVALNHRFHTTLYAVSGRPILSELNHALRYRAQHYLHAYMADSGSMALAQGEHRAILEACRQHDAEKAAALVAEHVAEVGRAVIEYARQRARAENT
jgi:DNA-binding GntR family transcriptional regulator